MQLLSFTSFLHCSRRQKAPWCRRIVTTPLQTAAIFKTRFQPLVSLSYRRYTEVKLGILISNYSSTITQFQRIFKSIGSNFFSRNVSHDAYMSSAVNGLSQSFPSIRTTLLDLGRLFLYLEVMGASIRVSVF